MRIECCHHPGKATGRARERALAAPIGALTKRIEALKKTVGALGQGSEKRDAGRHDRAGRVAENERSGRRNCGVEDSTVIVCNFSIDS